MKRIAVQLAASFACWTALALTYVANRAVAHVSLGEPADPLSGLWGTMLDYWLWAALTPLIFALAKRTPFTRATWGRAALVHLGGFVGTAVAHDAIVEWAIPSEVPEGFHGWPVELRLLHSFDNDVWMYGSIVIVASGMHYYRRFRERDVAAARLREDLVRAELQALRNQLNPHLLFNALNSVAALMHEDVGAADDMLVDLSHLLRVYLSGDPRQETTLREELELVDAYVGIQKHRFADRLSFARDVADDVLGAAVPSLLLQPLVENAILHGIAPGTRPGRVRVRAERRDGALRLVVADDGAGMKPGGSEGIGLSNTRARLRQLYGDAQRLEIQTEEGAGVTVTITLPLRTPEATPEGGVRDEDTNAHRGRRAAGAPPRRVAAEGR
jgi:two-component system LytT family sensor kinase